MTTPITDTQDITIMETSADIRLLRLMQLVSPALPVGAFAYSQGLEWAVEAGWVTDAQQAGDWVGGLLTHGLGRLDLPILFRLYDAWKEDRFEDFAYWNQMLLAGRATDELLKEDLHMGQALLRLLKTLQADQMKPMPVSNPTFTAMFAVAACHWEIDKASACTGYLWSWCENQTAAAIKLVPLGQTDGQMMLMRLGEMIPEVTQNGLSLADDAIGASAPGMTLASALHETQRTRLFRS